MKGLEDIVIIYPDYVVRSAEERERFIQDLRGNMRTQGLPNHIVPVLNGADGDALDKLVEAAKEGGLDAIKSEKPGVAEALVAGYKHCILNYPQQTVVRLDTAEHDPRHIAELATRAEEIEGHVIGDLRFDKRQLEPGSADEFAHLMLFPMISKMFLKVVSISCAHGYTAVYGPVLPKILEGAIRIASNFKDTDGVLPCWGFDGAMIGSAVKQSIPIDVCPVPAMAYRNRPSEKVLAQTENSLQMYLAAEKMSWG